MRLFTTTSLVILCIQGQSLFAQAENLRQGSNAIATEQEAVPTEKSFESVLDLALQFPELSPADLPLVDGYREVETVVSEEENKNGDGANRTLGNSYYTFKNLATSWVLASDGHGSVFTNNEDGGDYQKWYFYYSNGYYIMQNLATTWVLDSDWNGNVYTEMSNGGTSQQWKGYLDGSYYVFQNYATNFVLYSDEKGYVYANAYDGGSHQKWSLY